MKNIYMRKIAIIFAVAFTGLIFTGCDRTPGGEDDKMEQSHTLIMYLIGSNNGMQSDLSKNIDKVLAAVDTDFPVNGKIFIYFNRSSGNTLYEVKRPDKKGNPAELIQVSTYDQSLASVSAARIKEVVLDVKAAANTETYGFAMGTHGAGWFPPSYNIGYPTSVGSGSPGGIEHEFDWENSMTRHFGPDNGTYGSTEDLVGALSGQDIQYMIFDMCFMSSVEFMYDLRNVTQYIVASPAEIMVAGMPYERMIPVLFSKAKNYGTQDRLIKISDLFVKYYEAGEAYPKEYYPKWEDYKSAAITVIRTSGLDGLASAVKNIFDAGAGNFDIAQVQPLENMSNHAFFDLRDYLNNICENSTLLDNFDSALGNMILFESHTPRIYSGLGVARPFEAARVCGISSYIPREQFPVARLAYYNTAWGKFTQPGMGS